MARSKQAWADALRNDLQIETPSSSALSEIFIEEPPDLKTFVEDKQFLHNLPLGPIQFEFVRHFEQVLKPETYILMVEEFGPSWVPVRFTNEFAIEWGKGSGKDHCCQICFARVSNILLCMKNPQQYWGMSHQTIIHLMNVAASAPQAHGVFFKPLRTLLTRSPWFKDKFEGDVPGPQAQEVRFQKQIELISGHSQAETLEGKNLLAAIADEISAFPTIAEVAQSRTGRTPSKTSDGIIEMLRSSATTRFPKNFKLAQISYPRYKGDAIEQAIAKAKSDIEMKKESSRFYASGPRATWDVNPRYDEFDRVQVAGATEPVPDAPAILDDYEKNPAYARAKYECKPELAENRYFQNDSAIFDAFKEVRNEPVTFDYVWGLDEGGTTSEVQHWGVLDEPHIPGWQVRFNFASDFRPVHGALYAVHGDMAITGDRAGVAMSHVRTWDRKDWRVPGGVVLEQRPVVHVDFVASFEADAAAQPAPREVQIRWYRKLIWELRARGFNIMLATFDNFQSADTIQILQSRGIESKKVSTDKNNILWDTLRDVMYDGRLEGYWRETLVTEIQRLSLLKNGRVDHPPDGSKDEADALAGSVAGAIELGGDEGESVLYADTEVDVFSMNPGGPEGMGSLLPDFEIGSLGLDGKGLGSMMW